MRSTRSLAAAVRRYMSDETGLQWDLLWAHKTRAESSGCGILDEDCIGITVRYLYVYLFGFGMGRRTGLANASVAAFTNVFRRVRTSYSEILPLTLENLTHGDRTAVEGFVRDLRSSLSKSSISATNTMVSKIMMGIWGHCPAVDRFFKLAYPQDYSSWSFHKLGVAKNLVNLIFCLRDSLPRWRSLRTAATQQTLLTRFGSEATQIPTARMVDMAYWQIGVEMDNRSNP
jgi:hypothetical protein